MKTGLLFKKPFFRDWIVWLWGINLGILWIFALERVIASGGPYFSMFDIVSGTIDALMYLGISFIFPILPLLIFRKVYWEIRARKKSE